MVKLTSFMALSTLVIAPTFAAVLPNVETRDVAEPLFFGRDMGDLFVGDLFVREPDFELRTDLARRFWSGAEDKSALVRRGVAPEIKIHSAKDLEVHLPPSKHSLDRLDPALDKPHIVWAGSRSVNDDNLFERFYDDLD